MAQDTSRKEGASPEREALVYIGPNLPNHALYQYSVHRNGLTPHVKALVDGSSSLAGLFVPASDFPAARQRLAKRGSIEARRFAEVAQKMNT